MNRNARHKQGGTFVSRFLPAAIAALIALSAHGQTTWRGLTVADEDRCSAYSASHYSYSQSLEADIVTEYGGVYSPYTGEWFDSMRDTDIEHIVARSEAHDSGLCSATREVRGQFAEDLLNLTLADPGTNRDRKSAKDAGEWLPDLNQCWFVNRVIRVKQKYGLTIDTRERDAMFSVLQTCDGNFDLLLYPANAGPLSGIYTSADARAIVLVDDRTGEVLNITLPYELDANGNIVTQAWTFSFDRTAEAPVGFTRFFPSAEIKTIAEERAAATAANPNPDPDSDPPQQDRYCPNLATAREFQNCTELRQYCPSGVPRGHPVYTLNQSKDRDNDGWACET